MDSSSTPTAPQSTAQRLNELNEFANKHPEEFIRIFEQGKQNDDTPVSTPPADPQMAQLITALQTLTTHTPQASPPTRRENIKVTPYNGNSETLYRFLSELTDKIEIEHWSIEREKVIVAENLLVKGERADRLMESYRTQGRTRLSTFEEWKQHLTALCQDVGAQDKANRQLLDFHFDNNRHRSYAEYFAEFCVIAGNTSHSDMTKHEQLDRGTPVWLRRATRPLPMNAESPHWQKLAEHTNQIYLRDEQFKADSDRWKTQNPSRTTTRNPRATPTPTLITVVPATTAPSVQAPLLIGDPMDIDAIRTPQQATELVKGKKLTDWIRQVCNRFNLCLFCREHGHRIKECPLSTKIQALETTTLATEGSKNE